MNQDDKLSEEARLELQWMQLKSRKGYSTETLNMLLHEFLKRKGMFGELIEFIKARK